MHTVPEESAAMRAYSEFSLVLQSVVSVVLIDVAIE